MIKSFLMGASAVVLLTACTPTDSSKTAEGDKKIFRYNQTGGLKSLDPANAGDRASVWATSQLFNGLMELDENLHPRPALAESYEESKDEMTYTFKIRRGVHFNDDECFAGGKGREINAGDFVYSYKRILANETASTGSWIFRPNILLNPDGSVSDSAFVALDAHTLRIKLRRKFLPFLEILTTPYAFVVPKEAMDKYKKEGFRTHPVGTGAFRIKTWQEGQSLVLVKNEKYWKKDHEGRQLPLIDAVEVRFIEDGVQAFREFEAGKLDFITGLPENAKQVLDNKGRIKDEYKAKFNIDKIDYMNTEYIGFQLNPDNYNKDKNHPFLNKKFRQALSYAINREEMVASLRNGLGTPGISGITPKALPSFDTARVKGYTYNVEKARELLKEAGFPNGQNVPEITLSTYTSDKDIAEYVKKQWETIGVKVKITFSQFAAHKDQVDNGKVNLFRGSWLGDYADAENYLAMFYSKNLSPAGINKTNFVNKEFDALYDKAQETDEHSEDHFKLYEVYNEMDNFLMQEAPVIVLYYDEILRIYNKKVVNLKTNSTNILMLENVDFKTSEK